jgi:hypothetical protein
VSATLKQYMAARRVSVPLVVWKTPDAAATISAVNASAAGKYPVFSWDIVRGIMPANEQAKGKIPTGDDGPMTGVGNPPEMLVAMQKLPAGSVMFMHNAQLFTGGKEPNSTVVQAVWNLRDSNKAEHRMLVMLAPQMITPVELSNDILVIDESLPDEAQLREIVESQIAYVKDGAGTSFKGVSKADVTKAVDALSGLSAFAAEQTVAVSFEKNGDGVGLNLGTVWERKRQSIEETRGLSVWRDGVTLDDVQGCENFKSFAHMIINGRCPPRGVVFLDEIEKQVAGMAGDTSGVSQDQHMQFLTEMQNKRATGTILVGPPGAAKSMCAKAFGNTAGIVTIQMDLGAMKGSLLGESEQHTRAAFKVIDAVTQSRALYIATCNKISGLSPELKRRFKLPTFYFDLPTREERVAIWAYYATKYRLKDKMDKGIPAGVDENGWTGADIENCCERAWMFNCTIKEAAVYATPVCKTDPVGIEALREVADGKFLSANYEGLYEKTKRTVALGATGKREMRFDD